MRSASGASQMSPLPSTGMVVTCSLSSAMASHRAVARVQLLDGAGVQSDRGCTLVLGDLAGVEVGEVLVVDAKTELDRDRDAAPGRLDRGPNDSAKQRAPIGETPPPP